MVTYNFIFDIGQNVLIKPLNEKGKIISLWIGSRGKEYEVRYFMNGEPRTVYFYDWELEIT